MVLLGAPATTFEAVAEPTAEPNEFVTSAYANHWGRSDLRAYLNGVDKQRIGAALPLDTTKNHSQRTSGFYESQFAATEYALIQPFTYATNVLDQNNDAASVYETTDKFWLPSGNITEDQFISWGTDDVRSSRHCSMSVAHNKRRLLPVPYWSRGTSDYAWLRSPFAANDVAVVCCEAGYATLGYGRSSFIDVAAAFKMILSPVSFASAASAAAIFASGGSQRLDISGSYAFGIKTSAPLPDYGMYLKTSSSDSFSASNLTLSGKTLTVDYSGGDVGQYVVVHAFKTDSLSAGHTSYVAAHPIEHTGSGKTLQMPVNAWGLSSLDGYTIKVWMEDDSGSLAKATTPTTFYGTSKGISKNGTEQKNTRVFAMKDELQCSWGDLSKLSDDDYKNVLNGTPTAAGSIAGKDPTNQKIYYGTDSNGAPLQFWIAGRETAANDGEVSDSGDVMTLYQAKSVEIKLFNASDAGYTVPGKDAVTLQLADKQSVSYTGSPAEYPQDKITFQQGATVFAGADLSALTWQHRTPGSTAWNTGMPTDVGTYEIRCYAKGTTNYERTYSAATTFTIAPFDLKGATVTLEQGPFTYDGTAKTPAIESITSKSGVTLSSGAITALNSNPGVLTYNNNIDAGTDSASVTITGAGNYTGSVTAMFSIKQATPTYKGPPLTATYGAKLRSLTADLGTPTGVNKKRLTGRWTWVDDSGNVLGDNESVGGVGNRTHKAKFTPTDTTNYSDLTVDVSVKVMTDTSTWGTAEVRRADGKTQYVDADGMTSVEVPTENGIIWLREESHDASLGTTTAAWYGLDNSSGIFAAGSRFYVYWLNESEHPEEFDDIDAAISGGVDSGNGWLFRVGVIAPDGTRYETLSQSVDLYVQIGDDWDKDDLLAFYVTQGEDESVPVRYTTAAYPEGTDEFGVMTLSHFSPYFIFDELTDEEKAAFDETSNDVSTKTGDEITYFTISGLGLIMTLALGLMLNSKITRKKFDE